MIFGRYPCCAHWVQNVTNCGGLKMPHAISQLLALSCPICAGKSSLSGGYRPRLTTSRPLFREGGGMPGAFLFAAVPSRAVVGMRAPPFFVRLRNHHSAH